MTTKMHFDKSFWPEAKKGISIDIDDLLTAHAEAFDKFVAESLIDNPPMMVIKLNGDEPEIEVFLWDIGGDVVVATEQLVPLIELSVRDYLTIRGEGQAEDVRAQLANLNKLETAVKDAKDRLSELLSEFVGAE